jgi:ABC-type multidrug transport system ATPase subunit
MAEVERLCERVIIMKKGRIEDDDKPTCCSLATAARPWKRCFSMSRAGGGRARLHNDRQ